MSRTGSSPTITSLADFEHNNRGRPRGRSPKGKVAVKLGVYLQGAKSPVGTPHNNGATIKAIL